VKKTKYLGTVLAGAAAGAVNGLLGAGGGMVLVPLLTALTSVEDDEVFPTSVSIILPICLVSLAFSLVHTDGNWRAALPYLAGSTAGGLLAGFFGRRIPTKWLHRILGGLLLWGGVRYLC